MKNKLIIIGLAFSLLFGFTSTTVAQSQEELLQLGDTYLSGINTELNYAKAFEIYDQLSVVGNTEAMNRLASMYRHGFGVAQNLDMAISYYQQAADEGLGKASYNLGNMIKSGEGIEQDFELAFQFFLSAYLQGYIPAVYSVAYCYFKGLGVEQDYAQALEYFQIGADDEMANCVYFIGYCHVGGYGVEQDINKGMQYIQQALLLGSDPALAFITENRIEQYIKPIELRSEGGSKRETRAAYKRRENSARNELSGTWKGKLLCYDWSGKRVETEKNLTLRLRFSEDSLRGTWIQDDKTIMKVSGHLEDTVWVFDNMQYFDAEMYYPWLIEKGAFQIKSEKGVMTMEGVIDQYSPEIKEPAAPVAMLLTRSAEEKDEGEEGATDAIDADAIENLLNVSPNPFTNNLQIAFFLNNGQNVNLQVYEISGQVIYNSTEYYNEGQHSKLLTLDVPAGMYCVSIKGQTVNLTTLVIKK